MTSLKSMIEESKTHKNFCPLFAKILGEKLKKKEKGFEPLYNYINLFFFKVNGGIMKLNKINNTIEMIEKDIKNEVGSDSKYVKAYLESAYFVARHFKVDVIPNEKQRICEGTITDMDGNEYKEDVINVLGSMKSFCYDKTKPYDILKELSKKEGVKDGFKTMMNHIKKVWANNDDYMYDYLKRWMACTIKGVKVEIYLYLKSQEGTGKTRVIDFLRNHVLGNGVVSVIDNVDEAIKWSHPFKGKLLVNFNEPTTTQPKALQNWLKNLTDKGEMWITEKNKSSFEVNKTFNIIITSNDSIIHLSHKNKRRCTQLDINEDLLKNKEENKKYFNNLSSKCFNDDVGKYFYFYFINYYDEYHKEKDFHNFQMDKPTTKNYTQSIAASTPTHISFLKDEHLRKNNIILHTKEIFYENYLKYCKEKHYKSFGRSAFFKNLYDLKDVFVNDRKNLKGDRQRIIYGELSILYDKLMDDLLIDKEHDDIDKEDLLKLPYNGNEINYSYINKTYKPKIEVIDDEPDSEDGEDDKDITAIQLENEKKENKELKGENHKLKDEIRKLKELLSKSNKPENTEEKEVINDDDNDDDDSDNESINLADFCEQEEEEPVKVIQCKKKGIVVDF